MTRTESIEQFLLTLPGCKCCSYVAAINAKHFLEIFEVSTNRGDISTIGHDYKHIAFAFRESQTCEGRKCVKEEEDKEE